MHEMNFKIYTEMISEGTGGVERLIVVAGDI